LFFLYAALVGISLSTIFHIYTESSITRVFFISAAAFGALSIWGYTTQRDLSGFGTFLFMGVIGIVIASLVNIFLRSSGLDWMISIVGVGVFAGLPPTIPSGLRRCMIVAMMPLPRAARP
jgi:FtsH-binding integral membrane protein